MSLYIIAKSNIYNTLYISDKIWNDYTCEFLYNKGFIFKVIKEEDLDNEGLVILYHVCKTKVVLFPKIHTMNYKFPIIRYFTELKFHLNNLQRVKY